MRGIRATGVRVRTMSVLALVLGMAAVAATADARVSPIRPPERGGTINLISQTPDGIGGDHRSHAVRLDDSGRFVVFSSAAGDLVEGDTNDEYDVFLRDRARGTTTLLSRTSSGAESDHSSGGPDISADGRYVVFHSEEKLTPDDTNIWADIYRLDRSSGVLVLVSKDVDGGPTDDHSFIPRVSDDGRFVAFESFATNLTDDPTYEGSLPYDVFVRDVTAGKTLLASGGMGGAAGNGVSEYPSISGDGRYVGFSSGASNLVADDVNLNRYDAFVFDRTQQTVAAVSRTPTGETGDGDSYDTALSADGRFVVYGSRATDLVGLDRSETREGLGQLDVYLYDRRAGTTTLVSVRPDGQRASGSSWEPAISPDGRYVSFTSTASDVRRGSLGGQRNAYRRDLAKDRTVFVTRPLPSGGAYNGYRTEPTSSGYVVFESQNDVTDTETPTYNDVYIRRLR